MINLLNENQEKERGICIVCPGHAHIGQELAHTLIALEHTLPVVALTNPRENEHYKIMIPKDDIHTHTIIAQAIEELNLSHDLIEILSIESEDLATIFGGMTKKNHIERMMQQLEIEDKIQENIIELSNNRLDLDYDFSSLGDQEEPRAYNHKYAKKFHQKTQGKINTKGFSKSNYNRKK